MTDKQRKIRMIILWMCIIIWGTLAVILSRQEGTSTSELSYGLSERLSEYLYARGITFSTDLLNIIIRKAAHILIYLVLGGLMYYALAYTLGQKNKHILMLSIILCLSASSLDEVQKIFIPGRHCDPEEILLNSIAAVVGICIGYFCKHHKKIL